MLKRLLLAIMVMFSLSISAQSPLDVVIEDIRGPQSFVSFAEHIERKLPVRFFFVEEWIEFSTVDETKNGKKLGVILNELCEGSELSYSLMFNYAIIFSKDPAKIIERENLLQNAYESRKVIEEVIIGDRGKDYLPGKPITLRGVVTAEQDRSKMSGVTVHVGDLNVSATTDANGQYALSIPAGEHIVEFSHLNFAAKVIDLKAYRSGSMNIVLEEAPTFLAEVEVSDQAIVSSRVGQTSLQIQDIKRAPTFLGEIDVIKNLQAQAGVTTVGEVAGGFNVRGGSVDQNLVLFDGVPILNTSHALGFFSGFNSDAIGNVTFYRGGIPAEYGGRASSVLNITAKEGTPKKWSGSGGIGLLSSYATIGGPLKADTTTIIGSFRSSYSNWMLGVVKSNYQDLDNSAMRFYDGAIKFAHRFSDRTKLAFTGYSSFDEFSLSDDTVYSWRNYAGTVKVDHAFNEKLFSTWTLGGGRYEYAMSDNDPEVAFQLDYSITYPSLNIDFNYNGAHALAFGLHNTYYGFEPGRLQKTSEESSISNIEMDREAGLETALYFSDAFRWKDVFHIEAGLRYSLYNRIGPGKVYLYRPGGAIQTYNTIGEREYGSGEIMKTYHGVEPRFSVRYEIGTDASVKLGYNRVYQYLHLITNTAAITPVDVWQSSNTYFRPQRADQISLGYFRTLKQNMYEAFVEGFYKRVANVLDFKDGADLILNPRLETALISGRGDSYGVEMSMSKAKGRLQGFVNYTFSRSFRKMTGGTAEERVNNGEWYRSNYDQPHVANLNWRYGISRRHFFSGNFTYHTGRPMSVPRSAYMIDGVPVADFSMRNTSRIPDYHRLDLAFIIEGNHKVKKLWDGTWIFSFYNVYARKNAYSVFYREGQYGNLTPYKLSVIGTIIPTLTYSFKF